MNIADGTDAREMPCPDGCEHRGQRHVNLEVVSDVSWRRDELKELRAKLLKVLQGEGGADGELLDRYDAARAAVTGEEIRQRIDGELRMILPEFQDAFWQGMHRAADIADPAGAE